MHEQTVEEASPYKTFGVIEPVGVDLWTTRIMQRINLCGERTSNAHPYG